MIKETKRFSTNRLANTIFISKSGKYLGAGTPDYLILIWDEKGKQILKKTEDAEIRDLFIFDNEEEIAYICGNKRIVMCNLSGEETWDMKIDVSCIASSGDGKLLSCGTNLQDDKNYIYIIDREASGFLARKKGKISFKEKILTQCSLTAMSKDGSFLIFGLANSNMLILDPKGNHLYETKTKGQITCISITDDSNLILYSTIEGFLTCLSRDFKEKWTKQFKNRQQLISKISGNGNIILASSKENEIMLLDKDAEPFWKIIPKYTAQRIAINFNGDHFAAATSADKSVRKFVNESKGKESLIPYYIQKIIDDDDSKFAVKMIKECGSSSFPELINAIKEEKFNDIKLEMLVPILDMKFFKMLLVTLQSDVNNLPIIKAIDILNNHFEDLPQILYDSLSEDKELYKSLLDKISSYSFQRESPSMYRLLGILYFKAKDFYSSMKFLTESLMFENVKEDTISLLSQAQQNYMKEITLSKIKHDIYIPFSLLLIQ